MNVYFHDLFPLLAPLSCIYPVSIADTEDNKHLLSILDLVCTSDSNRSSSNI